MSDWIELPQRLCEPGPTYVRGACRHTMADVVPVESVDGTVVAQLCTRCDMALHADWTPPHDHDCSLHTCWRPGCCNPRRPDCLPETS